LGSITYGVYGKGDTGIRGEGTTGGVYGKAVGGYGVYGTDGTSEAYLGYGSYGVYSIGKTYGLVGMDGAKFPGYYLKGTYGVIGVGQTGALAMCGDEDIGAVLGDKTNAVYGWNGATTEGWIADANYGAYGGYGSNHYGYLGSTNTGVYGYANDASGYAVYADQANSSGYAIYASGKVTANNTIETTAGGVKFPDGTTQTTAYTGGSSGDYVLKAGDTMTGMLTMSATTINNANGTVSLPSYSFSSDNDTGIYRSEANTLDFTVNGTRIFNANIDGINLWYGSLNANTIQTSTATTLSLYGAAANDASAVGAIIDNSTALTTSGAKLLSLRNAAAEKAYLDKDGTFSTGGLVRAVSLESTVATGTAPLTVASSTLVTNLNADKLDGHDWSEIPGVSLQVILGPETQQTTTAATAVWVKGATTGVSAEGTNYGVLATNSDASSVGILANSSTPPYAAVYGSAGTNGDCGGYFQATDANPSGTGVMGVAWDTSNPTYGGYFYSASSAGYGLYAENAASSGTTYGIYGKANSASGYAVYGTDGTRYGYLGSANYGGYAQYNASNKAFIGGSNFGVSAEGTTYGVYGYATDPAQWAGYFAGKLKTTDTGGTNHVYDIAELIPCAPEVGPADVVVINPSVDRQAKRCDKESDPKVIGIISADPQLSIGDQKQANQANPGKNFNFIALAGQVPCKVSTKNGPIYPGDLLTTSDIPGHAVKSIRPGTIVAKALETFDGSKGETGKILVFVNVGWFGGTQ
jgi:hypothetical protein